MLSLKTIYETFKTRNASLRWFTPRKMLKAKTALGVDISDKRISLALLKGDKNGVELLTSANAPVPDGAIKNGNIEDAAILAKTIKNLKNHSKIRTTRAAVSLFTEPVITQIMDIPKQSPSNIGQYVHDQVKHFAVLPSNKIALDFCGVAGADSEVRHANRLLVVAADDRKVDEIVKVYSQADLTVEMIEPPLLAYIRALYSKKIAGKFDCNVLIVILRDNTLTLCVFRRQAIDFVRTNSINKENAPPNDICQWLAEQINMVIQFYDVENPNSCGKWEITAVADYVQLPENAEAKLKSQVTSANLQLLTSVDICQDTVVFQTSGLTDCQQTDKPSLAAIGLAMKLLDTNAHNLGVNLLPPELIRIRSAQRGALITANIAAAVLLIMILAIIVPDWKIKKLNQNINRKKVNLMQDVRTLTEKRASVNKKINAVTNQINQLNDILGSHHDINWPSLLSDIGKAIPRTVSLTALSNGANSVVLLKGLAASNEAVYWFMDRLNKSERINTASITQTERNKQGLINYEIRCTLTQVKENNDVN